MIAKGMSMSVVRRSGSVGPSMVTVLGVLTSHDQDVTDPLPVGMQVQWHGGSRLAVALEVRALYETSEQRQVTAVPVVFDTHGRWVRDQGAYQAGGAYLVADDTRMAALLQDLSGYAYEPAVALHDRSEH